MGKNHHEKHMHKLYIELVKLQNHIVTTNQKVLILLEGRDAAGKDGTIKQLTMHLSPRDVRVVALRKPTEAHAHDWYFQRYAPHLPSDGEIVIFNRSWYNRAGVEKVMGFCTPKEYEMFFHEVELFEKMLIHANIIIFKYYLDISRKEQAARLEERLTNPLKQWKLSPIDKEAQKWWKDYTEARDAMLLNSNFKHAPWYAVDAEDKDKAHIALISHLLHHMDYAGKDHKLVKKDFDLVTPAGAKHIKENLYR